MEQTVHKKQIEGPRQQKNRDDPISLYCREHSTPLDDCQKELLERSKGLPGVSAMDQMQLFRIILRAMNAKRIVEVGVLTGFGTLSMALELPADGKIYALDVTEDFLKAADTRSIWKKAGVEDKIELMISPAIQSLENLLKQGLGESIDMAFIDANKNDMVQYYELCLKLVRPGGLIAVDNTLWAGRVLSDEYNDPETNGARAMGEKIRNDKRVRAVMTDMADGVLLCNKL